MYVIFSCKKQIDFKAEPLMFLDLASCMKSLYSTSEQYLHKAERTFPSSVSFLKSFANGHCFKSGDRYGFFLTIGYIFFWVLEEKGALSGLRQFLATESPSKMKNAFYFTSKALHVLKISKFLSWLFGHVSRQLD